MRFPAVALLLWIPCVAADEEAIRFLRQVSLRYLSRTSYSATADLMLEETRGTYYSRSSARAKVDWTTGRQRVDSIARSATRSSRDGRDLPPSLVLPIGEARFLAAETLTLKAWVDPSRHTVLGAWAADAPPATTAQEATALLARSAKLYGSLRQIHAEGVQVTESTSGAWGGADYIRFSQKLRLHCTRPSQWTVTRTTAPGNPDQVEHSDRTDPSIVPMLHDDIAANLITASTAGAARNSTSPAEK